MCLGHLVYTPQPQFTNRRIPAGHVTPYHGYATYPPVLLMPPQQGIPNQPYTMMTAPLMPFGGIRHTRRTQYCTSNLYVCTCTCTYNISL